MAVTQVGKRTVLAQIIQMVEDAQGSKASIQKSRIESQGFLFRSF